MFFKQKEKLVLNPLSSEYNRQKIEDLSDKFCKLSILEQGEIMEFMWLFSSVFSEIAMGREKEIKLSPQWKINLDKEDKYITISRVVDSGKWIPSLTELDKAEEGIYVYQEFMIVISRSVGVEWSVMVEDMNGVKQMFMVEDKKEIKEVVQKAVDKFNENE